MNLDLGLCKLVTLFQLKNHLQHSGLLNGWLRCVGILGRGAAWFNSKTERLIGADVKEGCYVC